MLVASSISLAGAEQPIRSPREGWNFRFKGFPIGAWWPPTPTDAEYQVYREAGFNVVESYRGMAPDKALELGQKHGLKVLIETYAHDAKPWGGTAGPFVSQGGIHAATLPELKWLHARYGRHPALIGYLLGDDFWTLPPSLVETTRFLHRNAPQLFPWICQNKLDARSLAQACNPIGNLQVYPTLYMKNLPVAVQTHLVCQALELCRRMYRRYDLIMWPMLNVDRVSSDSLVRFSVYAALAYGAQGIWYYKYGGGSLQKGGGYKTVEQVKAALQPRWAVVAETNHRVTTWADHLLGRRSRAVFYTGHPPISALRPGPGRLVEQTSEDLLVGILTKPGAPPLAMVVDTRVDRKPEAGPKRQPTVRFARAVTGIDVLARRDTRSVTGHTITLGLRGGDGQLLALRGTGFGKLCPDIEHRPVAGDPCRALGPDGLLLHLTFDEFTGQVARDVSGAGNHAWVTGVRRIKGTFGGAVSFPDKGAIGIVWDAHIPATDAMSVAMWVRLSYPTRGFWPAVSVGSLWCRADLFEIVFGKDNLYPKITNQQDDSGHGLYVHGMKRQLPPGVWGHVAVCAGPKGATVYVNGRPAGRSDYVGRFDFVTKNIQIGRRGGGEQYRGDMDELKIWGRCLSAEEVKALAAR